MPWRPLAVLLAALLLGAPPALAQGINYTVQVVALSDRDAALAVVSDLLREGYPAYAVRSTSAQGDVFRVRVGAFANRPAALHYADAMPEISGSHPVPALAEAIPAGITPLAPRLLLQEDVAGKETRLLALPGGALALREQWRVPLGQAEYVIFKDGAVERTKAWQLVEDENGVRLRVRDLPLWPDTWQQDAPEVRQGYLSNLAALIAERLGVGAAEVEAARYVPPGDEVPRLIVVERVVPGAPDGAELLGVGLPASGMTPAGPIAYLGIDPGQLPGVPDSARLDLASRSVTGDLELATWSGRLTAGEGEQPEGAEPAGEGAAGEEPGGEEPADPTEDAAEAQPTDEPADDVGATEPAPGEKEPAGGAALGAVQGDGWSAVSDGKFVRLTVLSEDGGPLASWRACVGTPLWSDGHYLLALQNGVLLVYDFLAR